MKFKFDLKGLIEKQTKQLADEIMKGDNDYFLQH